MRKFKRNAILSMCLLLAACWATNASAQDEGSPRSQARSEARAARMQQRGQIPAAEKSRSRGKQEKAAAAEEAPAHIQCPLKEHQKESG